MTPAKLVALMGKRMDQMELAELPVVKLTYLYSCSHRDPGDPKEGRPPAPEVPFDEFRVVGRNRRRPLAAKDDGSRPGGAHNLMGAKADRSAWEAFARSKRSKPMKLKE